MTKPKQKNLFERVTECLPRWKRGFSGIEFPDMYIEAKFPESYSDEYIYIGGCHYDSFVGDDFGEGEYTDFDKIREHFVDMIREDFPDCDVKVQWSCDELEILKPKKKRAEKVVKYKPKPHFYYDWLEIAKHLEKDLKTLLGKSSEIEILNIQMDAL